MDKDIAEELQETIVDEAEAPKEAEATQPEKLIPVSRVNELVKKAKYHGERKMQEQLDAARQQIEQLQAQQGQQPVQQPQGQQPQQQQQQQGMSPEQMQQVMAMVQKQQQDQQEKAHQAQLEKEVNDVAE